MHATHSNPLSRRLKLAALSSLFVLSTAATGFTAMVPLAEATSEIPGTALGTGTSGLTGTVIAAQDSPFSLAPEFQGILRSMVVDTGSGFDFYYQLVNTGSDPMETGADIFRVKSIGGFTGLTLSVSYSTDIATLDFAGFSNGPSGGAPYSTGTKSIFSADRDAGSPGSVGFDFSPSHFLFDPANVDIGQTSMFAVVRTNVSTYLSASMDISGNDTARIASYAPVPEPQAAALFALGSLLLLRRRAYRW